MVRARSRETPGPDVGTGSGLTDGAAGGGADLIKTPPMRSHSTTAARTGGVSTSPMSTAATMAATSRRRESVSQCHHVDNRPAPRPRSAPHDHPLS